MPRTPINKVTLAAMNAADPVSAFQAADATNGMEVVNRIDGKLMLHVKNAGVEAVNMTIRANGLKYPDLVVNVPAGGERVLVLSESWKYEQENTNLYWIDFDVDTDVTVAAFDLP